MFYIVAARETFEMLALPGGAYAVREGEYGKIFKDGRCSNDNWYAAYNFLHALAENHKGGTGHGKGGRKARGNQLPKLNERILHTLSGFGGGNPGNGKSPTPSHGAEQHIRHEVPEGALV